MGGMKRLATYLRDIFASTTSNPAAWFVEWTRGGLSSDSGVVVNGRTALTYAPLWNAVNKIGGHIGQLPLVLYEEQDERTKKPAYRHPSYRLMKTRPNPIMTAAVFKEVLQAHAILHGNGRGFIERNNRGEPASLVPLLPDKTETVLVDGAKWHVVTLTTGQKRWLPDRDVLHIPGLGYDGLTGYSLIEMAKNSIGLGLAAEKHINKHFKQGSVPPLVLEAPPGVFKESEKAKEFLNDWNRWHEGVENSGRTGLLREGIKANVLGMKGSDAQWLEERRFQRQEAALWTLLESILGDDSSVSYNSLEQKNLAYLANCLNRWVVKWEQECDEKLLTESQKRSGTHFFKFKTAALLRSSTYERYQVYQIGRQIGVMSANDVRELEDMEPYEGGDDYSNPAINPKQPTDNPSENGAEVAPTDQQPTDNVRRTIVSARFRSLLDLEASRVNEAAGRVKNFCDWLDSFYSGWWDTVHRSVDRSGGEPWHTSQWIDDSRKALLQLTGDCTASQLPGRVAELTATWGHRAEAYALQVALPKEKAA